MKQRNVGKLIVWMMTVAWLVALPVLEFAVPAWAQAIDLPRTGQTTTYATGDDGDIQAGVAWPVPRFTDNGNGTVTDNLTGLMWTKGGNAPGPLGCVPFVAKTWADALTYIACLNAISYLGYADWRLPNVNELESLINAEEADTATWLNGQGFAVVQSAYYWSSTTYAFDTSRAWDVNMSNGYVNANSKVNNSDYVWPVRGATTPPAELWKTNQTTSYTAGDDGDLERGVTWPSPRFTDNGNGTVTDNLTGLVWLKNADCFGTQTWANALNSANTLNSGECGLTDGSAEGDWRMPNRKELRSLIDYSQNIPALPAGHPFTNVRTNFYWSSSTDANIFVFVWAVNMWDGDVITGPKVGNTYVWPVRAPSCLGTGPYRFGVRAIEEYGGYPNDHEGIPGVEVVLTGPGGCTDTMTTNARGRARFGNLAPGTYTVTPTPGTPDPGCAFAPAGRTKTITTRNVNARFIGSCP